jgi:hypothetical protein
MTIKPLGVPLQWFIVAIITGLCIAFVFTFATAPHPVEVPVQIIKPVPTPAPVIITATPTLAPTTEPSQVVYSSSDAMNVAQIDATATQMFQMEANLIPIIIVVFAIGMFIQLLRIFGGRGEY